MRTTRSGSENGNPRRKRSCIKLKMAVFMPMPSASVIMARQVNPGDLRSCRRAKRKSLISLSFSLGAHLNPRLNDPAIAQLYDAIAITGIFLRMGDLHDGHAFRIQFAEQLHDLLALTRMQVSSRFVCK